jgi:hypothetical protein
MNAIQIALDIEELLDILCLYLTNIDAGKLCLVLKKNVPFWVFKNILYENIYLTNKCCSKCSPDEIYKCAYCNRKFCDDCIKACANGDTYTGNSTSNNCCLGYICDDCQKSSPTGQRFILCERCNNFNCEKCIHKCPCYKYCGGYLCNDCITNSDEICQTCHKTVCTVNIRSLNCKSCDDKSNKIDKYKF